MLVFHEPLPSSSRFLGSLVSFNLFLSLQPPHIQYRLAVEWAPPSQMYLFCCPSTPAVLGQLRMQHGPGDWRTDPDRQVGKNALLVRSQAIARRDGSVNPEAHNLCMKRRRGLLQNAAAAVTIRNEEE